MGLDGLEIFVTQFGAYGLAIWILWGAKRDAIRELSRLIELLNERDREKTELIHQCAEVIGADGAAITHNSQAMKDLKDTVDGLKLELVRRRCLAPEGGGGR